jgi:hypothetical protein
MQMLLGALLFALFQPEVLVRDLLSQGPKTVILMSAEIVALLIPGLIVGIRQPSSVILNMLSVLLGISAIQVAQFAFFVRLEGTVLNWAFETGGAEVAVPRIMIVTFLSVVIAGVITFSNRMISQDLVHNGKKESRKVPLLSTLLLGFAVLVIDFAASLLMNGAFVAAFPGIEAAVYFANFCNLALLFLMGMIAGYVSASIRQINVVSLFILLSRTTIMVGSFLLLLMSDLTIYEVLLSTIPAAANIVGRNPGIIVAILWGFVVLRYVFCFLSSAYCVHFMVKFIKRLIGRFSRSRFVSSEC